MTSQVKSKQRVNDHGEVFTADREINAMLDMVKSETERIDSRFLEPACGDGNFLAEILRRKLAVVNKRYRRSQPEWEKYAFVAVASLYGVELLNDNVLICRDRLEAIVGEAYTKLFNTVDPKFMDAIGYVLSRNILNGNALSMMEVDMSGEDTDVPIVFSEWSFVIKDKVKRRDFRLDELLEGSSSAQQYSLFGSSGTPTSEWEIDPQTGTMIPKAIWEYPVVPFKAVQNNKNPV